MSICFITALTAMVSIGWMVVDVINLAFPEQRCAALRNFNSNDRYMKGKKKLDTWSEEKITAKRLEEREYTLQEYHNDTLRGLTNSLVWILISSVFFGVHWRLYRKL